MGQPDYYVDRRYCARCREYVRYLISPESAYCVCCGSRVRLFSEADRRDFERSLASAAAIEARAGPSAPAWLGG